MPDNLSRAVIDSCLPPGSLGKIKSDGDLDKLLDGIADGWEDVANFLKCLSCVRNPYTTSILSDLEREYGIKTDDRLSENTRRETLATTIYQGDNNGSVDDLQNALNVAGFAVQVHENSPAVDPDLFLNSVPFMVADGDNAYAGYIPLSGPPTTAIAGRTGGELLVNGNIYEQRPDYESVASGDYMYAGNSRAVAGYYNDLVQELFFYEIPNDPIHWPAIFFVGGDATRNVAGELTAIATADVSSERKTDFKRIILKYKPLHTWAGLIINYK